MNLTWSTSLIAKRNSPNLICRGHMKQHAIFRFHHDIPKISGVFVRWVWCFHVAETPEVPLDSLLTVLYSLDYVVSSTRWLLGENPKGSWNGSFTSHLGIQLIWEVINWQVASFVHLPSRELYNIFPSKRHFWVDVFPFRQVGYGFVPGRAENPALFLLVKLRDRRSIQDFPLCIHVRDFLLKLPTEVFWTKMNPGDQSISIHNSCGENGERTS